ncbi:MAG: hypothetical protein WBA76_01155 [Phormidesmis sp.]
MSFNVPIRRIISQLRRIAIIFVAGILVLSATACSTPDTTASRPVPEATEADVQRAQGNLSDQEIDMDVLSQQGESRARVSSDPVNGTP